MPPPRHVPVRLTGRRPLKPSGPEADGALLSLLRKMADDSYRFTTPAPVAHRRVLLRRGLFEAASLEDVFGWSRPFRPGLLDGESTDLMEAAGILARRGSRLTSELRIASVGHLLFFHSAFPPKAKDAVFFGPDSYHFVDFIRSEAQPLAAGARILDIGAGAGVGGIFAHAAAPHADLTLADINPLALRLAQINAAFAGQRPAILEQSGVPPGSDLFDLILANPPYIGGSPGPTYSDGGGALGTALALDWARTAMNRLTPGGRLLLYSGAPMVGGRDPFRRALAGLCDEAGCTLDYRELDADVFPSSLWRPSYWGVERIAAVGAVVTRRSS